MLEDFLQPVYVNFHMTYLQRVLSSNTSNMLLYENVLSLLGSEGDKPSKILIKTSSVM